MTDYGEFLSRKVVTVPERGLPDVPPLASHLFPFQAHSTAFLLRVGSGGLFLDTGLGKTAVELEWCAHAAAATNGRALILTPLAVARQIEREGKRWGYDVRVIREADEVREGISVCNYDRLHKLDTSAFGAVALDEASILKSFTGKTTRALIESFEGHRFRLSATATPAPNDHMELGQHAEFLGLMPSNEMLMRWFIADQTEMGRYRLKHHAESLFWDWMASWARMAEHPRDLGDDQPGYDLPALRVHRHHVEEDAPAPEGALFGTVDVSATDMHRVKRATADARARIVADLSRNADSWLVWCDTDYEADALWRAFDGEPAVREVRGSMPVEMKEKHIAEFIDGTARVLITKPSVCGWGLNLQHVSRMAFVGRSFSYEAWYQAVRRCWRFGQMRPVDVHLIVASGEDSIARVIDRKSADHARMKAAMRAAMARDRTRGATLRVPYNPTHNGRLPEWIAC